MKYSNNKEKVNLAVTFTILQVLEKQKIEILFFIKSLKLIIKITKLIVKIKMIQIIKIKKKLKLFSLIPTLFENKDIQEL
ncbi:hypothetical protein KKP89_01530 [Methanothermococcus sp. SCGC AD-155-N22]|nr:hypothetical protein [Methanothermococcus sp. SCGC AD-155-N22]